MVRIVRAFVSVKGVRRSIYLRVSVNLKVSIEMSVCVDLSMITLRRVVILSAKCMYVFSNVCVCVCVCVHLSVCLLRSTDLTLNPSSLG